jgi:hypothetical protein
MTDLTNPWLQFLTRHGARVDNAGTQQIVEFEGQAPRSMLERGFVAPLTDLGLIAASGDDAAHFLHNQLTNDVEHLEETEARLAGYCSPKGRLLATFLIWKSGDTILLQLPRHIQATVQKRLQMFILRSKAKLADATDAQALLGVGGEAAAATLQKWFPLLPATPYAKTDSEAGSLIRIPDAFGAPRYQWIAPLAVAEQAWPELIQTLVPTGTQTWRLADIQAGIPQITQPTQEQFVPQMINYELIGGVNFRKGCYPGQEIVARSQYLGKLKRRMLPASLPAIEARAGMEVFSSADPAQPCGMIVNAEPNLQGGADCLVEVKLAAAEADSVHLSSAQGPRLTFGSLPYPVPG